MADIADIGIGHGHCLHRCVSWYSCRSVHPSWRSEARGAKTLSIRWPPTTTTTPVRGYMLIERG